MIIFLILFLTIFTSPVMASEIEVVCPNDTSSQPSSLSCTLTQNSPLFDDKNIAPGFISTPRIISVQNQDTDNPCFLKASTIKKSGDDLFLNGSNRLNISIVNNSQTLYTGPLIFDNQSLGQVNANSTKNYNLTISFSQSAGNDYQSLSTVFDIDLNFVCANNPDWTPPVTNPDSGVYLSEFMPQPSSGQEWLEIYNDNNFTISLDGWQVDDIIPAGSSPQNLPFITISAKSFYVYDLGTAYLNNTGDDLNLINNLGQIVENVSYTSSSSNISWSKQADSSWCQTDPTRGIINNLCKNKSDQTDTSGTVLSQTQASSSPPTCNDLAPDAPTNLSITSNGAQATLSWQHVSSPYTSYLIAYGPTDGDFRFGNPNIGTSNTYIVSGLTPGAQYCFYVRAQNACMPGKASETVCINSGSPIPIVETQPPEGFLPDVLGETTNNTDTNSNYDLPDILGDADQSCSFNYIPLLFILSLLLNSLYFYKNPKGNLILPLFISLTTLLIDYFVLSKACCLLPNVFCRYFFIGNIISLLLPKLVFKSKK